MNPDFTLEAQEEEVELFSEPSECKPKMPSMSVADFEKLDLKGQMDLINQRLTYKNLDVNQNNIMKEYRLIKRANRSVKGAKFNYFKPLEFK